MTKINEEEFAAMIADKQDSGHFVEPYKKNSWKDKRIAAINKLSNKRGHIFDETNPWFDQWIAILASKAKTIKQFKEEWKNKNGSK
jgi:hypothetical protein